jgi:hypothetical protein
LFRSSPTVVSSLKYPISNFCPLRGSFTYTRLQSNNIVILSVERGRQI